MHYDTAQIFCRVFIRTTARQIGVLLALEMILAVISSPSARASIIVPQPHEFAMDSGDEGSTSSNEPAPTSHQDHKVVIALPVATTSGTSSTSVIAGAGGGNTALSLAGNIGALPPADSVTSRLGHEARLSLPMPPVGSLFRPPSV